MSDQRRYERRQGAPDGRWLFPGWPIDRTDHLVSLHQVEELLRKHAEERYKAEKTKSAKNAAL